jgi:hypothetical protein
VELVANPGFETGTVGWTKSDKRTTLGRTCAIAHGGSCAGEVGRTRTGNAVLDDSPNTVSTTSAGATHTAVVWVRAPAGRSVTLRLRERRNSTTVRTSQLTATGTGARQQLTLVSAAASGGTSLSLELVVSLAAGTSAQVDDVSLRRS